MKKIVGKRVGIVFIIMMIIMFVVIINFVVLHMQYNTLRKEKVTNINFELSEMQRVFEIIDQLYIKRNFEDGAKYHYYVNHVCHHIKYVLPANDLSWNMGRILCEAYDPIFTDLSLEEGTLNKEKATKLLKEINDSLMLLSKDMRDMEVENEDWLLEPTSSEYIEVNKKVIAMTEKYVKLVDNYFVNN